MQALRYPPQLPITNCVSALKEEALGLTAGILYSVAGSERCPRNNAIRALAAELRLVTGALFSLESLSYEIEVRNNFSGRSYVDRVDQLACLQHLRDPIVAVATRFGIFTPYELQETKEDLASCRYAIAYIITQTSDYDDLVAVLRNVNTGDWFLRRHPRDIDDWLAVLNHPFHNRPPQETNMDLSFLETRRALFPQYSYAAKTWPAIARVLWHSAEVPVKQLFVLPRSWNFVQFALELARNSHPLVFGPDALDYEPLIQLTGALCDGSVSPLHVAAVLALPELCASLIADGADANLTGRLGSPLYCAFVGTDVLRVGDSPPRLCDVLGTDKLANDRSKTIVTLLNAGASALYKFRGPGGEPTSLAMLAFWHGLIIQDVNIFTRFIEAGVDLDRGLAKLVTDPVFGSRAYANTPILATLLTIAFDSVCVDASLEYVKIAIASVLHSYHIEFSPDPNHGGRLTGIKDDADYRSCLVDAIRDDDVFLVRRLVMDPRFDPRLPAVQVDGGTILHLAVDGYQETMTDILIKAGADGSARDAAGRTPFLLVDTAKMLSIFLSNKLATTDRDDKGRNIWHYAAANNDVGFLRLLNAKDPSARANMQTPNVGGHAPLDKALGVINRAGARVAADVDGAERKRYATPAAARFLLEIGANGGPQAPYPRVFLAVEWGSMDLLQSLLQRGETCRLTHAGMNALHCFNFASTPDLVSHVMGLCEGMPISVGAIDDRSAHLDERAIQWSRDNYGLTPAEMILNNTKPYVDARGADATCRSQHPSCAAPLSEETYSMLLTTEVLEHRDADEACAWERFCTRVVPHYESTCAPDGDFDDVKVSRLEFYRESLRVALGCLCKAGATLIYEQRTGRPAVMCLATRSGQDELPWSPRRFHLVRKLLREHATPLTDVFYGSAEAQDLARLVAGYDFDMSWYLDLLRAMDRAEDASPQA